MDAQTLVPLYLTVVMIVLCALAIIGGRNVDKQKEEESKKNQ
jgi:hypothetical protein